nr:MAG TPA: hypothetical protein [Caudoviricetes sp.]
MKETTKKAIYKMICDSTESQTEQIFDMLFSGTSEQDSEQKIYSQMLLNGIKLSTYLSVQMILDLLIENQIVELDERQIQKLLLQQLSSAAEERGHSRE